MVINEINCMEILPQNPAQWQHARNASKYYHNQHHFIQILTTNEVERKKGKRTQSKLKHSASLGYTLLWEEFLGGPGFRTQPFQGREYGFSLQSGN